jgi:hypothetical protein
MYQCTNILILIEINSHKMFNKITQILLETTQKNCGYNINVSDRLSTHNFCGNNTKKKNVADLSHFGTISCIPKPPRNHLGHTS